MKLADFISYFPYIFLSIIIAIIIWFYYMEKRRKEKIMEYAQRNGFEHDGDGSLIRSYIGIFTPHKSKSDSIFFIDRTDDVSQDLNLTGVRLFDIGHSKKTKNIISIPFKNSKIFLFDYYYTLGSGKSSTRYSQTVVLYKSDKKFPSFNMRPESFFDSISAVVGYNDMDFNEYPIFSQNYYLKSKDETLVKEFFNDSRIRVFEEMPEWYVEANNNFIVFYRKKIISLKKYIDYIDELLKLLNSLDI